jgi:hypothetical protein
MVAAKGASHSGDLSAVKNYRRSNVARSGVEHAVRCLELARPGDVAAAARATEMWPPLLEQRTGRDREKQDSQLGFRVGLLAS